MVCKSLALGLLVVAACQGNDSNKFPIGGTDGPRPIDAFKFEDAHVFEDAHIPPDAFPPDALVPRDASPLYTRTCVNKNPVVFQGTENLTIAFVCASAADAGAVQVTLKGGSGSGAETRIVQMTLVCAPGGMPANNFLQLTNVTQQLLATHVAGTLFDVDCT